MPPIGLNVQLEKYLLANVLPQLVRGLVTIHREHPEDPVQFLESFIRQVGQDTKERVVSTARNKFYDTIREVEELP